MKKAFHLKIVHFTFTAILPLFIFSCGKDKEVGSNAGPVKTTIALEEALSADGACLSVPKYFDGLNSLAPNMLVREVPISLEVRSRRNVRQNFLRLLAYGTFAEHFMMRPVSEYHEFRNIRQDSCKTITALSVDGSEKVFEVVESSPSHIRARAENGETIEFHWLSPTSVRIVSTYEAFDVPCGSEKSPILMEQARVLDWSQGNFQSVNSEQSHLWIDRDLIALASEAVGFPVAEVYQSDASGNATLIFNKVEELKSMRPRPEVLSCTGAGPIEPPVPEDADHPEEGTEENVDEGAGPGSEPVDENGGEETDRSGL